MLGGPVDARVFFGNTILNDELSLTDNVPLTKRKTYNERTPALVPLLHCMTEINFFFAPLTGIGEL